MPSLVEIHRGVAAAMISGDPAALAGLGIVAGAINPAARIDIYRGNVFGNYRKALATAFPVVRQLVGAEVDLREGGDSLLIVRGECGVDIERLNPGEAALLGGLAAGETLAVAADLAIEAEPAFDLPAALRRHVANHVLAAFVAPESAIEERPR